MKWNVNWGKKFWIIEFSGKKSDWKNWWETFLLKLKRKDYKKLLVGDGSTGGADKIPVQDEFEETLEDEWNLDKKIFKLGEFNELSYEGLIFLSW